ncbi:MAG: hypothetical protein ACKV19_07260 [Verrucomicrobiales bacterium]
MRPGLAKGGWVRLTGAVIGMQRTCWAMGLACGLGLGSVRGANLLPDPAAEGWTSETIAGLESWATLSWPKDRARPEAAGQAPWISPP